MIGDNFVEHADRDISFFYFMWTAFVSN